mmetsp:Transcript_26199/g.64396  ORF Transcript_26199/g.64396 Transcript_26199/m.64396 type:complete len:109 (+) Transcript_26199:531-857(+)
MTTDDDEHDGSDLDVARTTRTHAHTHPPFDNYDSHTATTTTTTHPTMMTTLLIMTDAHMIMIMIMIMMCHSHDATTHHTEALLDVMMRPRPTCLISQAVGGELVTPSW